MTGLQSQAARRAQLPEAVARLQQQNEGLYLSQKTLERELLRLRAEQPVLMQRPPRPILPMRVLYRYSARLRQKRQLQMIRGSGLFDADWYLQTYEDVAAANMDPALHFLLYGASERRDPGPHFETAHYLHLYPDISERGLNPLVHYIQAGWDEKRSIRPGMPHGGVT